MGKVGAGKWEKIKNSGNVVMEKRKRHGKATRTACKSNAVVGVVYVKKAYTGNK